MSNWHRNCHWTRLPDSTSWRWKWPLRSLAHHTICIASTFRFHGCRRVHGSPGASGLQPMPRLSPTCLNSRRAPVIGTDSVWFLNIISYICRINRESQMFPICCLAVIRIVNSGNGNFIKVDFYHCTVVLKYILLYATHSYRVEFNDWRAAQSPW